MYSRQLIWVMGLPHLTSVAKTGDITSVPVRSRRLTWFRLPDGDSDFAPHLTRHALRLTCTGPPMRYNYELSTSTSTHSLQADRLHLILVLGNRLPPLQLVRRELLLLLLLAGNLRLLPAR